MAGVGKIKQTLHTQRIPYFLSLFPQTNAVQLTNGPHIATFVIPPPDDLWRDSVRRPDRLRMHLPEREMLTQAKIDHDQLAVRVLIPEQEVLQLIFEEKDAFAAKTVVSNIVELVLCVK
jgi:hypothetical protein